MEKIKAKFIGEDGSMGFRKGTDYDLFVTRSSVRRAEDGPWIPYGTLEAFFRNWSVRES